MPITKVTELQRCEVYTDGRIMVVYSDKFDDPDDDLLPTQSNRVVHVAPHSDVSAHLPLVQDIAAGAWTNIPLPSVPDPVEDPEAQALIEGE